MKRLLAVVLLLAGAVLVPALPAGADGDIAAGKRVFERCSACHSAEKGGPHRVGPNLWGVFGTEAASRDNGFNYYSEALRESGIVWTEETMSEYLENPGAIVPGTRMKFAGLKDENQREDVIAYLKSVTQ